MISPFILARGQRSRNACK